MGGAGFLNDVEHHLAYANIWELCKGEINSYRIKSTEIVGCVCITITNTSSDLSVRTSTFSQIRVQEGFSL